MSQLSDNEIIELILSGDTDLFQEIIERYKERVFKIVSSHIPADNIEEVASDIFFKLYKGLSKFKNNSPFLHYVSVIAVNTCRDFWRVSYNNKEYTMSSFTEESEHILESKVYSKTPEDEIIENQQKIMLKKAMEQLKPTERTIINMLYIEERSITETALLLELTESNIKVISFRARKKLADILNAIMEG